MRIWISWLLVTCLAIPLGAASEKEPLVHAIMFISSECPDCSRTKKDILPPIRRKFGKQLRIRTYNISTKRGSQIYESALKWVPIPKDKMFVPTIVISHNYLVGSKQIKKELETLVEEFLVKGGSPEPEIPAIKRSKVKTRKKPPTKTTLRKEIGAAFTTR